MSASPKPPQIRPAPIPAGRPGAPQTGAPLAGTQLLDGEVPTLQRLGYVLMLGFLFIVYSRVFDVALSRLHIPGISVRVMGLLLLLSGAFLIPFKTRLGKYMLGFTACMVLAVPFSVWRSGSLSIAEAWAICVVIFLGIAGLVANLKQCRTTMYAVAWGVLALTLISFRVGESVNGRFVWTRGGKFGNPNDLAQALLIGMPLWWLMARRTNSAIKKIFAGGVMLLIMSMIAKTGSRGAVVAIVVVGFVLFVRSEMVDKLKIALAIIAVTVIAAMTLPNALKARLTTLVEHREEALQDNPDEEGVVVSAVTSTTQRKRLLLRSIILTLRHPLFGVGPGMFNVAEDAMARQYGERRGAWLQTHNSYTQVSSEVGIPALLFYLAMLIHSLRHTRRIYKVTRGKPEFAEICDMAIALNFVVMCFMITALFASVAYTNYVPVLAGLTCAFLRVSAPEVERAKAQAAQLTPYPVAVPPPRRRPVSA